MIEDNEFYKLTLFKLRNSKEMLIKLDLKMLLLF